VARGFPCVCFDVVTMPKIVENDVSASYFREKLRWLAKHTAETREIGRLTRERVQGIFT